MNAGGWIIMLLSVGFVTVLLVWCIYKILATPGATEHVHSEADIDTGDTD